MDIDYNHVKEKCIDWYAKEGGKYASKVMNGKSLSDIARNNYLGDKNHRSKFDEMDLTIIRIKEYSTEGYICFITAKYFNPKAGLFQSSWNYSGHIMKIEGDEVKYVTTPSLIPQKRLKRLESRL